MALKVHEEIQGPFQKPCDVTKKCLECHEDAANDIMKTSHWNWQKRQIVNGKEQLYGKRNSMTNFGLIIKSNLPLCTSCHIGFGWEDDSFDFTDKTKVDCLVCHDTTGSYKKQSKGAGMPEGFAKGQESNASVDLLKAQLTERYGLLLSQTQLAELLGRTPGGLRYSLSYPCDAQTRALKACGRKIGRRVYYPANEVAQIILGIGAP